MKLYRITGYAEPWPGCGKLPIDHLVSTSGSGINKEARGLVKRLDKAGVDYTFRTESIELVSISVPLLCELLASEDTSKLVKSVTPLKTFSRVKDENAGEPALSEDKS